VMKYVRTHLFEPVTSRSICMFDARFEIKIALTLDFSNGGFINTSDDACSFS